ncbi:MAG: ABC transporter substrate-binding protein [Cellvibrio sp.]
MKMLKKTMALAVAVGISFQAHALTVGFAQVGSESGWRTSFSESVKADADKRGITLKFSDAQQKQENQIKAVRSFIAQRVDAILIAPVVETGWQPVLMEAKRARIPVVILDRNVSVTDQTLYLTRIAPDFELEGQKAAGWLVEKVGDKNCPILELQGTVGSSAAIGRMKGFNDTIKSVSNINIIRSQTGEFTRAKGKEVMETMLKAEAGGKSVCAVWAHNDEMALGAIQAIKEAGLKPGTDIYVVSVDAVDDALKAIDAGEINVSVELSPHLGGPAFDVIDEYRKGKKDFEKWIRMGGAVFTQENVKEELAKRGL